MLRSVVPFVLAALALGLIVGTIAILGALELGIGRQCGAEPFQKPLAGFVLGAIVITLLYLVPVLGLMTFCVIGVWGLGGAVMAVFGGLRKELPERTPPPSAVAGPLEPIGPIGPIQTHPPPSSTPGSTEAVPAGASTPSPLSVPDALSFPNARFWERLGAAFFDVVLVSIVGGITGT